MSEFGAAIPFDDRNPYAHPKELRATVAQIQAKARLYFGWELVNGGNIEGLMRDPYWSYMEGEDDAT